MKKQIRTLFNVGNICLFIALSLIAQHAHSQHVDEMIFGDTASERLHGATSLKIEKAEAYTGLLGQTARRFLPYAISPYNGPYPGIYGGEMSFVVKVDSTSQNYLTIKFSGDETNPNRIILNVDGKECGTRHGGNEDIFFRVTEGPISPGAFYYRTAPLPISLTKGKSTVVVRMRSMGQTYEYCTSTFTCYQWSVTQPVCGMYKAYVHTNPGFIFGASEVQGVTSSYLAAPSNAATNLSVIKTNVINKINNKINSLLNGGDYISTTNNNNYNEIENLGKAYGIPYITAAYHNPAIPIKIRKYIDNLVVNSNNGNQTAGTTWGGAFGRPAYAVHMLFNNLTGLDEIVDLGGGSGLTRRQQWIVIFKASFENGAVNRRTLANQEMENAMSVYGAALGLSKLDPVNYGAYPSIAVHQLLEASGVEQFTGSIILTPGSLPVLGNPATSNKGAGYFYVTAKGTTKEEGYVSPDCYGNQGDKLVDMYNMTKTDTAVIAYGIGGGDTRILQKAAVHVKMQAAFTIATTVDGKKAIVSESDICVRIQHYNHVYYGGPVAAAQTGDPALLGYMRQMVSDGRFAFDGEDVNTGWFYFLPAAIDSIMASTSTVKLPSTPGEPDYVTADEDNAVVSVKKGNERLVLSFDNRSSYINKLVKVHHISSNFERRIEFKPLVVDYYKTGAINVRTNNLYPDPYTFANGSVPDKPVNAYVGQIDSFASYNRTTQYVVGRGYGDFLVARYGDYLIAMNMTTDLTKTFSVPADMIGKTAYKIDDNTNLTMALTASVPPRSTFVYFVSGLAASGGLLPDPRPMVAGINKVPLRDSILKFQAFAIADSTLNKVSIATIAGNYNLFLYDPFQRELTNAKYIQQDSLATQPQVDTALARVARAYKDLVGNKYSYSTNTLLNGVYFIKVPGTDSFYSKTNNTSAKPLFDTFYTTHKNDQRFNIAKESNGRYKITFVGTPPGTFQSYINEGGNFGTNAYLIAWNSLNIFGNGNTYAIQKAQCAGNGYWYLSGQGILSQAGSSNSAVPLAFPFELKPDIFALLDAKLDSARLLRDTTQTTTTGEPGKYPIASKDLFNDSIQYVLSIYNTLTTLNETNAMVDQLNRSMEAYKASMYYQLNLLPDGYYMIKLANKDSFYTRQPTGQKPLFDKINGLSDTLRVFYFSKQSNGRYKITYPYTPPSGFRNFLTESALFGGVNDYLVAWNTMHIFYNGKTYAIQRAQSAGNGYWYQDGRQLTSLSGTNNLPYPSAYPLELVYYGTLLPVNLYSFSVTLLASKKVSLHWVTSQEVNNSHFIIERSLDGIHFNEIGTVMSKSEKGNMYDFVDVTVSSGIYFYRLKQVDKDGKRTDLGIRSIKLDAATSFAIFPNPISKSGFSIRMSEHHQAGAINLYDISGRKLYSHNYSANDVSVQVKLNVLLRPGTYTLTVGGESQLVVLIAE